MLVELAFLQNATTRNYLMKNILLATTAIVAFAGAAAADGHTSVTWSGAATAGVAREGGTDAVANTNTANILSTAEADYNASARAPTAATTEAGLRADITAEIAFLVADDIANNTDQSVTIAALNNITNYLNVGAGSDAVANGDFDTYAEVNATVTGTVATDMGVTLSASMSVDAGTGYDFADDDGFDSAKTNGVGFDNAVLDGGVYGILTFAPDDLAQLVDDDDDASADIKYVNTFASATFTMVMDIDADTDDVAASAVAATATPTADNGNAGDIVYAAGSAAVAADVQWSAKVEAPVADFATVYAAFDEEGGNAFGGTVALQGVTFSLSSKLEALEEEEGTDRSNTIGASYVMGAMSVGASWNSIDDGNQWSINGAYAAGAISLAASTNEGEEWEITTAYALGDNASVKAGVNYTDDAFVGVAFNF
jgi:outer membrane protein OmpU